MDPLTIKAEFVVPGDVLPNNGVVREVVAFANYVKLVCEREPVLVKRDALVPLVEMVMD